MDAPVSDQISCPLPVEWNGAIAFLDRDGVINIGKAGYVNTPEELVLLKGSAEAISSLRHAGYRIAVVTNQSAISKGLWDELRLKQIHSTLRLMLLEIDENATDDEVKKAYKNKARKVHPDKHPDNKEWADEQFKLVGNAYYEIRKSRGLEGGSINTKFSFAHAEALFKKVFNL